MAPKKFLEKVAYAAREVYVPRKCGGTCVGIDMSIWIVRAVKRHAVAVFKQPDSGRTLVVEELFKQLCDLRTNSVVPVAVFDGRRLPAKADEQGRRQAGRDSALARCQAKVAAGEEPDERDIKAAAAADRQLLDTIVGRMHAAGMLFVVAPYEADAQRVALARARRIQYVLSDDADLLCYWTSNSTWGVVRNFDARTMAGELYTAQSMRSFKHADSPMKKLIKKWGPAILPYIAAVGGCDYGKLECVAMETALKVLPRLTASGGTTKPLHDRIDQMGCQVEKVTKKKVSAAAAVDHIKYVVSVYTDQVVYDVASAKDTHLSGAASAGSHCGELRNGAAVNISGQSVPLPQAWALGYFVASDTPATRAPVEEVYNEATAAPRHLAPWMVAGAELDPSRVTDDAIEAGHTAAGAPTAAELRYFLKTRNYSQITHLDSWPKLAKAVQKRLALECNASFGID